MPGGHRVTSAHHFCWPWTRTRPRSATTLPLDITIDVPGTDPAAPARTWHAAWNAAAALTHPDDGRPLAPHNQLWAKTGGHQQIGCIYTAQGLEYRDAGVIIGPDLTWNNDHWEAHPHRSRDETLRKLPADQYLRYALNIYRVLLTRGTDTTRIHSTHPTTQRMLHTLIHPTSPAG
ncbi:DNA/RNA helicase domain-containing protein [Streptomyces sp. NPDC003027]